jgi:hypothetical protein
MVDTPETQLAPVSEREGAPASPGRKLVLVAGSGRSGTSLLSGILQRLGFHVPQPEVPADDTNPRGFAESQWVVDFHVDLLARARIQTSDARPSAWGTAAEISFESVVERRLRMWLKKQFGEADHIVIKDPRVSWFLPLWRRCAEEIGVQPCFATTLRHPAAVIASKQRWYGTWQGDASRTAGWLNQVLFTERATRDAPRAFVRYDDLLADWSLSVGRLGDILELGPVKDASWTSLRQVEAFLDPSLSRSPASWDDFEIPAPLRAQADAVWELLTRLVNEDGGSDALLADLDRARTSFIQLYEEAEAIAQSSVWAAKGRPGASSSQSTSRLIVRAVPKRMRRRLPARFRRAAARLLS